MRYRLCSSGVLWLALAAGCDSRPAGSPGAVAVGTPAPPVLLATAPVAVEPALRLVATGKRGQVGEAMRRSMRFSADGQRIRVLVDGHEGARQELEALGATGVQRYGDVYAAELPAASVADLRRMPHLVRARAVRQLQASMDLSVPASNAESIGLIAPGEPHGAGVFIGLVDSGIDRSHRDFLDATGTATRVVATLNQVSAGAAVTDPTGHGTHVAGILAGNGRSSATPTYVGMAASAALGVVQTDYGDDNVIAGVAWVMKQAAVRGLPVAVNLSMGHHMGAHDGTDALERALDALTGPGRIIVAASGNQGASGVHAGGVVDVTSSTPAGAASIVYDNTGAADGIYGQLEIYHDSEAGLRVWLQRGDGSIVGPVEPQGSLADSDFFIDNATAGPDPLNGKQHIQIGSSAPLATGLGWRILLAKRQSTDPDATMHAWVSFMQFGNVSFAATGGTFPGNGKYSIALPASALQVVSVGAYITREYAGWGSVGAVGTFSDRGPTADGRPLAIVAPGSRIISTCSSLTTCSSGAYTAMSGTSMATPHVTGLAALMLEQNGMLGPDGVRSILAATARVPAGVDVPAGDWGHGKATAEPAIAMAGEKLPRAASVSVGPSTVGVRTTLTARGAGFTARSETDGQVFRYQWQRLQDGLFQNIQGANHRFLPPNSFALGELVRVVLTPVEMGAYPYESSLVGPSIVSSEIAIGSDSVHRGFTAEQGWSMISVPAGAGGEALLQQFALPLWTWNESRQQYEAASTIERGRGYFVDVLGAEGAMAVDGAVAPAQDFVTPQLTVTPGDHPGRHLIGNPFDKPIHWRNLLVSADGTTWEPVVTSSLIQHVFYGQYDNQHGQYLMYQVGGLDGVIHPWEAVFVIVSQPVYIKIPDAQPMPAGSLVPHGPSYPMAAASLATAFPSPLLAGAALPAGGSTAVASPAGWRLGLRALSGAARDEHNAIGLDAGASDGDDALDVLDGGSMNARFVSLAINRTARATNPGLYCHDIQTLVEGRTATWPLQVRSRGVSSVTVAWDAVPSGWELTLVDVATARRIDMRTAHQVTLPAIDAAPVSLVVEARRGVAP